MREKISIIVPVYNCEKYLEECLNSIISQTYSNIEMVLVDDGSTDNSGIICDRYSKAHNNIIVVHQDNRGLVRARKVGVETATGKWIMFVDSDDWIDVDMVENLYSMIDKDCDVACSCLYRQLGDKYSIDCNQVEEGYYSKADLIREVYPIMLYSGIYYHMGIRPNLVAKLLRKDLLASIQQSAPDIVKNGEDAMITYPYLLRCNNAYFSNKAWYHYRQYPDSMSQNVFGEDNSKSDRELFEFLQSQFLQSGHYNIMKSQLDVYKVHVCIQYELERFDEDELLSVFGGVSPNETIVIYGAGKFGKRIHNYLEGRIDNLLWVDKEYEKYKAQGLKVEPIELLSSNNFDKVLICVLDMNVTNVIVDNLQHNIGVLPEKIRRLDIGTCIKKLQ